MATAASDAAPKRAELQLHFHEAYQRENEAIQRQIGRLADVGLVGEDRVDAIDECLTSITKLSDQIKDASVYITAYDQRTYSEGVRRLFAKLEETKAAVAPKPKFSFRTNRKSASAQPTKDAGSVDLRGATATGVGTDTSNSSLHESFQAPTPGHGVGETDTTYDNNGDKTSDELSGLSPPMVQSSQLSVHSLTSEHVTVPQSSSQTAISGSLNNLEHCFVDFSTTTTGRPLASLMLKGIKNSLIVCGVVNGPVHVTDVKDSVIMTSCRQFRMHSSKKCDVYLQCSSNPIIEDCAAIRFAPRPELPSFPSNEADNKWDQVDDFKWIKAEQSPNWQVLPNSARIPDETWSKIIPRPPSMCLEEVLATAGVPKP